MGGKNSVEKVEDINISAETGSEDLPPSQALPSDAQCGFVPCAAFFGAILCFSLHFKAVFEPLSCHFPFFSDMCAVCGNRCQGVVRKQHFSVGGECFSVRLFAAALWRERFVTQRAR